MGFGAGVFLAGIFSEALGLAAIFFMFSLFYLFTGCFIMNIIRKDEREKTTDIYSKKRTERRSYRELFGNKKYMALLSSAFFFNGTCIAHKTYFGFLYTQAGGTIAGIGIIFF